MPCLNGLLTSPLDALRDQVSLHLACSKCSYQENESTYWLKEVEHRCRMEILLARCRKKKAGAWRMVDRRPSFPNPTHYDICRYYVPGLGCRKHHNTCTFAWSHEEIIVWTFERKHNMPRHVLKRHVAQAQEFSIPPAPTPCHKFEKKKNMERRVKEFNIPPPPTPCRMFEKKHNVERGVKEFNIPPPPTSCRMFEKKHNVERRVKEFNVPPAPTSCRTFEKKHNVESRIQEFNVPPALTTDDNVSEEIHLEFGGCFKEICRLCFYHRPQRISPKGSAQSCKLHWDTLLVHVVTNGKKKEQYTEIRPCPKHFKSFSYCRFVAAGQSCRNVAQQCHFAHSDVELAVWEAEQRRGLVRSDLLRPMAEAESSPEDSAPKCTFYCQVCLVTCESQESFENHCSSVEHVQLLAKDTLIRWRHRPPPYDPETFALCSRPDICEYGQDCALAHSVEELEEWIQRAKNAETKKKKAEQDGLLSYQDRLIAEYQASCNEVLIISEAVEGVDVTCSQPLQVRLEQKKAKHQWVFTVYSQLQKPLSHVALLKRTPGANFFLDVNGHPRGLTYASGESFKTVPLSPLTMEVKVCLECLAFGVYEQWLVLDFGSRPVLLRKLQAQVGQKEAAGQVAPAPESLSSFVSLERWHRGNRVVVPSVERKDKEVDLLAKYKAPWLSMDFQQGAQVRPITRMNYREEMHHFLSREEDAQQSLILKLNLQVAVSLGQMTEALPSGMMFAPHGQLYAHILTPYSLTPDSDEGYLMYRSVQTAFLALDPPTDNRVYEISVESKAITERSIWLLLPQRCCTELGLQAGMSVNVEVQFQINQLQFHKWHQAVDNLWDAKLLFPDVFACSVPRPRGSGQVPQGNEKQKQAVSFITGQALGFRRVPPLLIYGPFGTGKTFTLAKATLEIIKEPCTRVLICTHTNSAADIYIREYFHDYVTSGHPEAVPLRVKYNSHFRATDPITRNYCCLTPSGDAFCYPTKEQLDRHRIILTTSMLSLELGVAPGYFSHILIDEAAQMLECEALVPLSLATQETFIVLAGDHMQITPKLFCLQKGEQSADYTLLNRLFQYYRKQQNVVATKSRIIFNENYRSTAGIIEFVSRHFYIGKGDAISAKGNVPPHPTFYPLMFCHVAGSVERDASMTWYNTLEIEQIIEKVQEMEQNWPDEWGKKDLKSICVVSYGGQVRVTRDMLRKRSLAEVTVENYENLPGKQFRIIIISTVHTSDSLGQLGSSNLECFNNARVLNTIITRAQSQVIAVGDAVALCSYGQCSKIWKSYIKTCIDRKSITPKTLTLEEIRQVVSDQMGWVRGSLESEQDGSETDSWFSEAESLNMDDPILLELLDESKKIMVTVTEEGLLNVKSDVLVPEGSRQEYISYSQQIMKEYLKMQPSLYKRCEFVKEGFDRASAFTLDEVPSMTILIKGRVHCGMAFTGDEVLVEILPSGSGKATLEGSPRGKVVGVLKAAEGNRTFLCSLDEFDLRVMIPIDPTVTKIFVPGLKERPNVIPIRSMDQAGRIKVKNGMQITPEKRKTCLFVVQIIQWREGFYYPLGIVTEVLSLTSLSVEYGLRILDIEYCLPRVYPSSVTSEVTQFIADGSPLLMKDRRDCRDYITFTVDPLGAKDLDDAISVRDLGNQYEIGIHIADIASVIPEGCALDIEAKNRGASYYAPGKETIGMFPPQISQGLCSLLPQKDRLVISLFVLVDKTTDKMESSSFALSTICSAWQLTYEEAETIIRNNYRTEVPVLCFDTLEDCVAVAYHFSRIHRMSRLHEDCYYNQADESSPLGERCSHQMIEELMIMMNSSVADFLVKEIPTMNLTPLRCQMEPSPQQKTRMRDKYKEIIPLSIHLSHHLGTPTNEVPRETGHMHVLLSTLWNHLKEAASDRNFPKMLDLITTDDVHPKMIPVSLEFRKLLGRSYFICSKSCDQSKVGHYSLHLDSYTWVTSPIRRYIDVVLQRLLLSVILKSPVQYSQANIEFLCHDFNRKNSRANAYKRKAEFLLLAIALKRQAQQKVAFVVSVEGMAKNFKILFPLNKETLPEMYPISYRSLQLVMQPFSIEGQNIKLTWKKRVYSLEADKKSDSESLVLRQNNVVNVHGGVWYEILLAVRNNEYEKLILLLENEHILQSRRLGRMKKKKCVHYVEWSLELSAGDVLTVQLTTNVQRGFPVPLVQLWSVAPGFDICLEHSERTIDCFSSYATHPTKEHYKDTSEYRKVWLPLCDMEAASCAVVENDSIVLQDVRIAWKMQLTKKGQLCGTITFAKEFLKGHAIEVDFKFCYLCIRLSGLQANGGRDEEEALSHDLQHLSLTKKKSEMGKFTLDPGTYTWVAHGYSESEDSEDSEKRDDEVKMLHFYIHFTSMEKVPVEVKQETSRFTVELIPKLLPDVRKEKALWMLKNASELTKKIALSQPIPEKIKWQESRGAESRHGRRGCRLKHPNFTPHLPSTGFNQCSAGSEMKPSKVLMRENFDLPKSNRKLNPSQQQAISEALRKPFTLIQGPPGTGKTVVGAHIVYWFYQLNQEMDVKQPTFDHVSIATTHIMYCGPSNKSVDVVAEILMNMRLSLRPLRVYGESIETMEFPYPGSSLHVSTKSQRNSKSKREIRNITLHYLIRQPTNPYWQAISQFDSRVKRGEKITEEEVEKYKDCLKKARKHELQCHDVILCTCSAAFSGLLTDSLNVRQVLIDECAMAQEPETLIPLVAHRRIQQVVLLGDHKQLRPVVHNDLCRNLGMERSLFERYNRKALMLNIQYRMHRDICAFPSKAFYDNKLKTCPNLIRGSSTLYHNEGACCATIFGHIEGQEKSLMVSTEEGNENSRANLDEAQQVVRITKQLLLDRTTLPSQVAILMAYNAQVGEIKKLLAQSGVQGVTVCTIMKSQGSEWKYVIVSTVRSCARSEIDYKPTKSWQKKKLGFVIDPNQINVCITRAQEGLCIIGNSYLLETNSLWHQLLVHYKNQGCYALANAIQVKKTSAIRC